MRSRLGAVVAIAVTTATLVVGCGGDDDSSNDSSGGYCGDLQSAKGEFTGLLNNEIGDDTFQALREDLPALQAQAPAAVTGDWTTFSDAVETFAGAMDKAGLTMDDMRDMGTGDMPGGMDMETAMNAAAALGSAAVSTAVSRIVSNAANTCQIDLEGDA